LKQGGVVATGIDRPVEDPQHRPIFFGRPACLPNHHIHLALKAHAPVILVACRQEVDGKFHLYASQPIEMDPNQNHTQELISNAEKVLAAAELIIRQSPQQWSIALPVWPEAVEQVPD
jgi:KDO2-lipid IV(A) lauroyltransferase